MTDDRRLSEGFLPIETINQARSRGSIATLHRWWARRPLVACRAAVYGALVPALRFVPESAGTAGGKAWGVGLAPSEWYSAQHLGESRWPDMVRDPLSEPPELVRIQNPAVRLDHAKREIVAARFYEIPAEAIGTAAMGTEDSL